MCSIGIYAIYLKEPLSASLDDSGYSALQAAMKAAVITEQASAIEPPSIPEHRRSEITQVFPAFSTYMTTIFEEEWVSRPLTVLKGVSPSIYQ